MKKQKIDTIISACLVGVPCRWNSRNKISKKALAIYNKGNCVAICPEIMAGLGIPRNACEILNGKVIDKNGKNFTKEFLKGTKLALDFVRRNKIKKAVLKSGSPTCGCKTTYSGKFNGQKRKGMGVFSSALKKEKVRTVEI